MTTTPDDRQILRDWLVHHDNLRPATVHARCDKGTVGRFGVSLCSSSAQWVVDFGPDSVGKHPRCEQHTIQVIKSWTGLEQRRKKAKT
jgi:hypothetical protein